MGILEAIVVGDLHLDKLTNLYPLKHLALQANEIRKPFEYALTHGIPHVFLLGDIGDKPRLSEEAKIALLNLFHVYDGRLEIHLILGNHDVQCEGIHSLGFFQRMQEIEKFKSVYIYAKPEQKLLNGVVVNFLPFPQIDSLPSNLPSVNLAHFDMLGAKRDNGYLIKSHEIEVPRNNVWLIGHLHTPQQLGKSVYFPGTLYQLNFGESLPKGFAHFKCKYVNNKIKHVYRWIENQPSFTLNTLRVEKPSDFVISENPLHLYKVYAQTGVRLPRNLPANVINVLGYDNEKELQVISGLRLEAADDELSFGLTTGLTEYLTSKGATSKQIRRANTLLNSMLEIER